MRAIPSSMRGRLERVFVIVMAVFSSLVPHPSRDLVPVRVRARSISPCRPHDAQASSRPRSLGKTFSF